MKHTSVITKIVVLVVVLFFGSATFCAAQNIKMDSLDYYIGQKKLLNAINFATQKSEVYLSKKQFDKYVALKIRKANIYSSLNDNVKSLNSLYNAISIAEKHKLNASKTELYYLIGNKYSDIRDTTKAMKYYFKAKKIGEALKDINNLSHIYQNFFRLYSTKKPDSAHYYLEKKVKIDRNNNSFSGMAINYNNYFAYHSILNQNELGKKYLDSSIALCRKHNLKTQLISSISNLGYYYMVAKNDMKKAVDLYVDLLKEFDGVIEKNDLNGLYLNLIYAYENLSDYERANYYNVLYTENMSKIYNEQLIDAVREVETKYEIEKIETQYAKKQEALEDKQARNRKVIFVFLALLVFSVILFYFFYQNLQLKQRNKIKELDSVLQQNIINASLDGQEIERKKISEILHDQISALLSSAGLHLSAYLANATEIPEEIKKSRSLLKEAHDRVRDLSHELVPPLLAKLGLGDAIQDLCEKNSNSLISFSFENKIEARKRYKEEFESKIYFIITELINNIIKHSDASKGEINLDEENGNLVLAIKDDGIGFSTSIHSNEGFGLTQIKARVKKMNGTITIKSKENRGTKIVIIVKIP